MRTMVSSLMSINYSMNRKRRGRSKHLLSVEVSLLQKKNDSVVSRVPARIVYVQRTANRKDLAAISQQIWILQRRKSSGVMVQDGTSKSTSKPVNST